MLALTFISEPVPGVNKIKCVLLERGSVMRDLGIVLHRSEAHISGSC